MSLTSTLSRHSCSRTEGRRGEPARGDALDAGQRRRDGEGAYGNTHRGATQAPTGLLPQRGVRLPQGALPASPGPAAPAVGVRAIRGRQCASCLNSLLFYLSLRCTFTTGRREPRSGTRQRLATHAVHPTTAATCCIPPLCRLRAASSPWTRPCVNSHNPSSLLFSFSPRQGWDPSGPDEQFIADEPRPPQGAGGGAGAGRGGGGGEL